MGSRGNGHSRWASNSASREDAAVAPCAQETLPQSQKSLSEHLGLYGCAASMRLHPFSVYYAMRCCYSSAFNSKDDVVNRGFHSPAV